MLQGASWRESSLHSQRDVTAEGHSGEAPLSEPCWDCRHRDEVPRPRQGGTLASSTAEQIAAKALGQPRLGPLGNSCPKRTLFQGVPGRRN